MLSFKLVVNVAARRIVAWSGCPPLNDPSLAALANFKAVDVADLLLCFPKCMEPLDGLSRDLELSRTRHSCNNNNTYRLDPQVHSPRLTHSISHHKFLKFFHHVHAHLGRYTGRFNGKSLCNIAAEVQRSVAKKSTKWGDCGCLPTRWPNKHLLEGECIDDLLPKDWRTLSLLLLLKKVLLSKFPTPFHMRSLILFA